MKNLFGKWLPLLLALVGIAALILSIVLFASVIPKSEGYKKTLGTIVAVLLLVLVALIVWYLSLTRDCDPNFFLFDRAKRKNIPLKNLAFVTVNERMGFFLSMLLDKADPEVLWRENLLGLERRYGPRNVYRPLVAYKMLYDLVDLDVSSRWEMLFEASQDTVDALCNALLQAKEGNFVKAFHYLMMNCRKDEAKIKDFLSRNARYLRGRMLAYVKENIELFY